MTKKKRTKKLRNAILTKVAYDVDEALVGLRSHDVADIHVQLTKVDKSITAVGLLSFGDDDDDDDDCDQSTDAVHFDDIRMPSDVGARNWLFLYDGICDTQKEADLLGNELGYHHYLGPTRVYVMPASVNCRLHLPALLFKQLRRNGIGKAQLQCYNDSIIVADPVQGGNVNDYLRKFTRMGFLLLRADINPLNPIRLNADQELLLRTVIRGHVMDKRTSASDSVIEGLYDALHAPPNEAATKPPVAESTATNTWAAPAPDEEDAEEPAEPRRQVAAGIPADDSDPAVSKFSS